MQSAYIGKLMELAQQDRNVIHLLADSGTGYDELFRRNFPKQIYNFGIAEENMVAAAAGMATVGKIPFVFTAGAFLAYRAMEFIRNDICFQNQNVKIVGMGSGLAWSSLGPTHHTTEDLAVLRTIPNLLILSPATPMQTAQCVELAYKHQGPVYIRIGMNHEKEFYDDSYQMELRKNDVIRDGRDALVYVTGSILEEADLAAQMLESEGIGCRLINVSTIEPCDESSFLNEMSDFKHVFVIEEHHVRGGLAGIVAENAAYNGCPVRVCPIGIGDVFASGYGTIKAVRKANGLDAQSIAQRIKRGLAHE